MVEPLNVISINMISILTMPGELWLATLDLLKIKVFWHKGSDVIISIHDTTKNVLSNSLNCKVDVVMWPNCGYCGYFYERPDHKSFEGGLDSDSIVSDYN